MELWSFSGVWRFSPISAVLVQSLSSVSAVLVEFGDLVQRSAVLVQSRVDVWSFSGREMTSSFTARRSSGTDQAR